MTSDAVGSGYVSKLLSHFVGKNEPTDQDKFTLLQKILQEGRLIHPPTQGRITSQDGVVTVAAADSKSGEMIGQVTIKMDTGEEPHIEIGDAISIDLTEDFSINKMINPQMICFCDIPADHQTIHTTKYSKFGLSFTKQFLMNQGVCPVFYIANESRFKGSTRPGFAEIDARYAEQEQQIMQRVKSGGMTVSEGHTAIREIFRKRFDEEEHSFISRAELLNEKIKDTIQSLDSISRQLLRSGSTKEGFKLREIKTFIIEQILSYIQSFDASLPEEHRDNFYMEREWRSTHNIYFQLKDVSEIIVPPSFEASVLSYLSDKPEFAGVIRAIPQNT